MDPVEQQEEIEQWERDNAGEATKALQQIAKSLNVLVDLGTAMLKLRLAELEEEQPAKQPVLTSSIAAELERQKKLFREKHETT